MHICCGSLPERCVLDTQSFVPTHLIYIEVYFRVSGSYHSLTEVSDCLPPRTENLRPR